MQCNATQDIIMIDRSVDARKRSFGVAMYDYLCPLSKSQDFYAATDKLTEIVRPNLILAQKEVQALTGRRIKQKEALAMAEVDRAAAFPTKAETYGQKIYNFGKAGILHGGEAKIKTELSVTDRLIKGYKEDFGVALYRAFSEAEDKEGFLPTDRQIRNVYDTCRQDITSLQQQRKAKEDEIVELGGKRSSSETPVTTVVEQDTANSSVSASSSTAATATNAIGTYGATTTTAPQQSVPFPTSTTNTTTQQQSPAVMQVAGTGMFSHPVIPGVSSTTHGGHAEPFSANSSNTNTNTQQPQGQYNDTPNNNIGSAVTATPPTTSSAETDPFSVFL